MRPGFSTASPFKTRIQLSACPNAAPHQAYPDDVTQPSQTAGTKQTDAFSRGEQPTSHETLRFGTHGESSRRRRANSNAPLETEMATELAVEDTFFMPLAHKKNPFTKKIHAMENDPAFRRELKSYNGKLDDSLEAKFSKFALGTTIGFGAYYLSAVTNSTGLGIMAGAATSPFFDDMNRGLVKRWHQPPKRVKQKTALEDIETETQAGRLVQEVGTEWPRLIEQVDSCHASIAPVMDLCHGKLHFSDPNETAALIGTALISRYPEQQDALKATLPKLKESLFARKFILPALQQTAHSRRGYGACPTEPENAVNGEHPGMQQAVDTMVKLAQQEAELLNRPVNLHHEKHRYRQHLRETLPRLIDYLSEE